MNLPGAERFAANGGRRTRRMQAKAALILLRVRHLIS